MKNRKVFGAIACAGLLGAGAYVAAFVVPLAYKIEPGEIATVPQGGLYDIAQTKVTGEFHVRRVPKYTYSFAGGVPYLEEYGYSSRRGGACLVANPADVGVFYPRGHKCKKDSDCNIPKDPLGRSLPGQAEWSGYCDASSNKCWVRPGSGEFGGEKSAPFCNRSVDYPKIPEWDVGHYLANRTPLAQSSVAAKESVTWRVIACQVVNGINLCEMGKERPLDTTTLNKGKPAPQTPAAFGNPGADG